MDPQRFGERCERVVVVRISNPTISLVKNPNADNLGLILSSLPLRMQHELQAIMMEPVDGCIAAPKDESNLFEWSSTIKGPEKSPYAGGTFLMDIRFPEDYPFKAPKVRLRILYLLSSICCLIRLSNISTPLFTPGSLSYTNIPLQY